MNNGDFHTYVKLNMMKMSIEISDLAIKHDDIP